MFGNVFESCRTKNEPSSAWWTRPSSASDRKSSGTNERSAKYAIIAARCVPRSAKNLLTTRLTGGSMLAGVDAAQAISDLTEISPQVRHVAVIEADGSVTGSNLSDATAAERLAERARSGSSRRPQTLRPDVAQLEAATLNGSVFVVRDGERMIAATTTPEPTVGLVFYDLKTCLRSVDEPKKPAPRKRAPKKTTDDAAS